jgi:hypothetical protein
MRSARATAMPVEESVHFNQQAGSAHQRAGLQHNV